MWLRTWSKVCIVQSLCVPEFMIFFLVFGNRTRLLIVLNVGDGGVYVTY